VVVRERSNSRASCFQMTSGELPASAATMTGETPAWIWRLMCVCLPGVRRGPVEAQRLDGRVEAPVAPVASVGRSDLRLGSLATAELADRALAREDEDAAKTWSCCKMIRRYIAWRYSERWLVASEVAGAVLLVVAIGGLLVWVLWMGDDLP